MKQYKLPLIDGREIAFNSINAEDADRFYQAIMKQPSSELEEYIFNEITDGQYKDQLDTIEAGIVLSVIYASFHYSGVLVDIKEFPDLIEEAREKVNTNAYTMLYSNIIKAMHSYTPDMLKDKPLNELLELFAMAESILGGPIIDMVKLRQALGATSKKQTKASGKYSERAGKGASLINKDELKSLTDTLNVFENADFDELGHYIGNGNLL